MEKTLDNQLDAMVAVFRRDAEKAEQRRIAAESLRYDHRWGPHYTQAPGPSYDYSNGFEQQRVLPSIEQPGFGQAEQSPEAKVKVEECEEQDREPSRDYEYPVCVRDVTMHEMCELTDDRVDTTATWMVWNLDATIVADGKISLVLKC